MKAYSMKKLHDMLGQPALEYEKNQRKTEFLFLVPFV